MNEWSQPTFLFPKERSSHAYQTTLLNQEKITLLSPLGSIAFKDLFTDKPKSLWKHMSTYGGSSLLICRFVTLKFNLPQVSNLWWRSGPSCMDNFLRPAEITSSFSKPQNIIGYDWRTSLVVSGGYIGLDPDSLNCKFWYLWGNGPCG